MKQNNTQRCPFEWYDHNGSPQMYRGKPEKSSKSNSMALQENTESGSKYIVGRGNGPCWSGRHVILDASLLGLAVAV